MENSTETLLDEMGFEILVNYNWEESESDVQEGHGLHEVGKLISTELKSVELVIKGIGISLLDVLTEKQKKFIISLLTYPK